MLQVHVVKSVELGMWNSVRGRRIDENRVIGSAGHRDIAKRVRNAEKYFERGRHPAHASTACEHKRTVDVEKDYLCQSTSLSFRRERFPPAGLSRTAPPRS